MSKQKTIQKMAEDIYNAADDNSQAEKLARELMNKLDNFHAIIPDNLMEENKTEILNRFFENLSLEELIALEKEVEGKLGKRYKKDGF